MSKNKPNGEDQINQMAGMLFSMVKPMLKQSYGKPETHSVQEQADIIAGAIIDIFPKLEVLVSLDDVKGLLYNMKQVDLDEFYSVVEIALQHRRTE